MLTRICGGSILLADDEWFVIEPREIPVYDRIGGGDGFVGGLLYAILKGWETEKVVSVWLGNRRFGRNTGYGLWTAGQRRPNMEYICG